MEVLALLFAVNVCSVMDRTIFSITAPLIAADLDLSDTQIGALSGLLFSLFYATFGLPIARMADRGDRGLVISLSLACWSAITMATGAAQSFIQLAIARIGVAIGEAGATPASHAILAERYALKARPFSMAIHSAGAPLGAGLGLALGGMLAVTLGWRWAFVILGAPGALLALLVLWRLRERHEARPQVAADNVSIRADLAALFAVPSYRWLVAGFAVGAFIVNGMLQWLPTYFVRAFDASTRDVGVAFGIAYGLGAFAGMLVGGRIGSHLVARDPRWAMWIASLSYVCTAPLGAAALLAGQIEIAYLCAFLMSAAATAAYGPAFAMVQELAPLRLRSLASAVALFFATFIGAGFGPFVVGVLSDHWDSGGADGLRTALLCTLLLCPAPALLYLRSARALAPRPIAADASP